MPEASLPPFGKGGKSPSGDRGGKQYSLLPPRRWRQSRLRDCYQIYRAGKARSSLITFAARQTYHFFQSPLNPPFTQGGHGVGYPLYTRGARCGVSPLHKGGTVWGIPFTQGGARCRTFPTLHKMGACRGKLISPLLQVGYKHNVAVGIYGVAAGIVLRKYINFLRPVGYNVILAVRGGVGKRYCQPLRLDFI